MTNREKRAIIKALTKLTENDCKERRSIMINMVRLFEVFYKVDRAVLRLAAISFHKVRMYQDESKFRLGCFHDALLSCS